MEPNEKAIKITHYLVERILHQKEKPLLVAITGDSGSGKSYYSSKIQEFLKASDIPFAHIDFDDFLIPRKERIPLKSKTYTSGPFKGKTRWHILENWFYLDKFQKALQELKQGKQAKYRPYLRETGEIEKEEKIVKPEDIILLDTSLLFDIVDFVVLVDVAQETVIQRKLKRDNDLRTPEQIREMHEEVQGYFWERNKPKEPDIIVDNNDIESPFIAKIDL